MLKSRCNAHNQSTITKGISCIQISKKPLRLLRANSFYIQITVLEWCEFFNMFVVNRLFLFFECTKMEYTIGLADLYTAKMKKKNKHRTYKSTKKIYTMNEKNLYVSNTDDRSPLSAEWKSVFTMFIGAAQSFISPDPMESVSSLHFIQCAVYSTRYTQSSRSHCKPFDCVNDSAFNANAARFPYFHLSYMHSRRWD